MCVSMPNTSFPQHATPPHATPRPTGHLYRRLRIACQSEDNECVSKKEGQKKREIKRQIRKDTVAFVPLSRPLTVAKTRSKKSLNTTTQQSVKVSGNAIRK